jgi:MFS family permease
MSKDKKEKKAGKHGLNFVSSIVTSVFAVAAIIFYIIGASFFGYYNDFSPVMIFLITLGIVVCMASAVMTDKLGDKTIFSIMTIAASVLFAYALMSLAGARVYSIAVLLLSDLERDNVEGYYALYSSIGAMGLLTMGMISNIVTGFAHAYVPKRENQ